MPDDASKTLRQVVNEEKKRAEAREKFMLEAEATIFSELQSSNKAVLASLAKGNEAVVQQLIQQVSTDMSGIAEVRGLSGGESSQMIQTMVDEIVSNANSQEKLMSATQKFFESEAGQKIEEGYTKASGVIGGHMSDVLGETGSYFKDVIDIVRGMGTILAAPFSMFGKKKEDIDEATLEASELSAKATELLAKEATKKGSLFVHVVNLGVAEAALLSIRESVYKQSIGTLMWQARWQHMQTKILAFNKLMGYLTFQRLEEDTDVSLLTEIRDMMKVQLKQEFRDKLDQDEPEMSNIELFLLNIAGIVGFALGGLLGPILIPFIAIFKSITGLPGIAKAGEVFGKIGTWLTELKFFGKFFAKFGRAFKIGMKWIGLPITVLFGVIDFIKGYMSTEGDVLAKIAGGIKGAIKGFLEWPIKLIGWVVDKLTAAIFGQEAVGEGAAQGLFNFIDGVIDFIVNFIRNPFDMILNGLKQFANFFISLWNLYISGVQELLKGMLGDFLGGKAAGLLEKVKIDALAIDSGEKEDKVSSSVKARDMERAVRNKEQGEVMGNFVASQKELSKGLSKISAGQAEQTGVIAQVKEGAGAIIDRVPEPPDEIDIFGVLIQNKGLS